MSGYRWRLLAVATGLYVGFGVVAASFSPLVGVIADDLDLTLGQMGAVLGAWQFVYLFAAIPAGRYLDRVGLRVGLSTGIALIVMSGLLRAGAGGWYGLLAAVGVFGLGGPLVSIGVPTLVSSWFDSDERGLATGIAVSGPVVGSVITLLTANAVLMPLFDDRWRLVVASFAGLSAVLGLAWFAVTARPPGTVEDPWHRPSVGRLDTRALMAIPIVRLILLIAIATFFVNHALANWLPEMLTDVGLSRTSASTWAAAISLSGLVASLTLPRFADARRRRPMLVGSYLVLGIGLMPLVGGWGLATAIGLLLVGAMRAIVLPIAMLFMMESDDVGPTNMAGASALYFTAGEIGGVTGPVAVGVLADRGGFGPAVWLLVGFAIGLAAVSTLLSSSSGSRPARPRSPRSG